MKYVLNHLDLFTGIGGFTVAAGIAGGIRTVAFSEIEPYSCQVLKEKFPEIPNLGDIHSITRESIPGRIDIITGGFPCQPFSVAGKRRGKEDDRALWPEMLRVIGDFRPTWIIGENVAGIVQMELETVCADLETIGYQVLPPIVIPACAVDAKHRRDRVWVVGHSNGEGLERHGETGDSSQVGEDSPYPCETSSGTRAASDPGLPRGRHEAGDKLGREEHSESSYGSRDNGHGSHCVWGEEWDWVSKSGMGRVAHGVPSRSHRLRGLGNSIVPQVAAEILQAIVAIHNS